MKVELESCERTGEVGSAANVLLRQLSACGIDYFFANGGTDFPPIAEAFARAEATGDSVPRPMVIPHENLAVAMAHGVYMVSGRPQAVMVHVNVGTANAVNAVLDASRDETPVLLFAGRSPYSEAGRHGARTRYIHWVRRRSATGLKSTVAAVPAASIVSSFDLAVALPDIGSIVTTLPSEITA